MKKQDIAADAIVDPLVALPFFAVVVDGDAVVELIAGELKLLAAQIAPHDRNQIVEGEIRIAEQLKRATGREIVRLLLQPRDLLGIGRRRRRDLLAAPFKNARAIEPPDGHA